MVGLVLVSLALGIALTIGSVAVVAILARQRPGLALASYVPALDSEAELHRAWLEVSWWRLERTRCGSCVRESLCDVLDLFRVRQPEGFNVWRCRRKSRTSGLRAQALLLSSFGTVFGDQFGTERLIAHLATDTI